MSLIAIVQARLGSTRLPGKVLKPILGRPMLWHIAERLRSVSDIKHVVVATSDQSGDEPIRRFCYEEGIAFFAGSENDVLDRFYQAATRYKGEPVIRVTGDCPFADPEVIKRLLALYHTGHYDYVGVATGAGAIFSNSGRFPDGLDAECFSLGALELAWREATHPLDREHVTPYIWRNKHIFRCGILTSKEDYSQLRWTVDNHADFQLVSRIYEALYNDSKPFLMSDILNYLSDHSELMALNQSFLGKEGYQKLWEVPEPPGQQDKLADQ